MVKIRRFLHIFRKNYVIMETSANCSNVSCARHKDYNICGESKVVNLQYSNVSFQVDFSSFQVSEKGVKIHKFGWDHLACDAFNEK